VIQITLSIRKKPREYIHLYRNLDGTRVAGRTGNMVKTTTLGYALLLVVAFIVGLCGTLAASRAVMRLHQPKPITSAGQPVSTPEPPRAPVVRLPVEC
jgi:hypothetical protein